jgi:chemotaxis protein histidine kinase CheA
LAILDGMIVRVGSEHYIIPITNILETLRPRPEDVRHVEGHSDVINVRGEFVSVIYLYRTFCEEEVSGKEGIESVLPGLPPVSFAIVGEPTEMQPAVAEKGLMVLD